MRPPLHSESSPARTMAGLYLHVPFCSAVCPYCDFAVQVGKTAVRSQFVDALVNEARLCRDWSSPIDTIYLGGGTPSILEAAQLASILTAVRHALPVETDAVVHLEANPEDVTPARVGEWLELGVTMLSLGVQSFVDDELRTLGRRHTSEQASQAVRHALAGGIPTVSVDLIFGLPGQSLAQWSRSLETVVRLSPPHISCYQLTIHEGTTYFRWRERGKLREMPEDEQAAIFERTHELLGAHGWNAYEVSNFARSPGHRSKHNQKYWSHAPYLGLGPSAHSFDGTRRWWNHRDLARYHRAIEGGCRPVEDGETLTLDELALETLMLRLRTREGVDLGSFESRFSVDLVARNRAFIAASQDEGLLEIVDGMLRPSQAGLAVADGLVAALRI